MNRYAALIRGCSVAVIVLSILLVFRRLPVAATVDVLEEWISSFGLWGVIVFVLLYIAAALLLLPGSALTLAAGALFGLLLGTVTASVASTTAAVLAFLISRYLAREQLALSLRRYPRFDALDRAIGEGGWKSSRCFAVAGWRLITCKIISTGSTRIRFWPMC